MTQNQQGRFRVIWWGWARWWKRPVWACSVELPGGRHVRELGVGPLSVQRWSR